MHSWSVGLAAFALWQSASAKVDSKGNLALEPLKPSDLGLHKRDTPLVNLQPSASVFWGEPSNVSDLLVNVTLASGQDELLISTDSFSSELSSVSCQDNDLSLTFTNQDTYNAAIKDWDWVNFADNHTFVMIVNYGGCGEADERQPWIVTGATYDATTFNVQFAATQKSWTEINNEMTVEWGSYIQATSASVNKRITFSKTLSHTFDLTHDMDTTLFSKATQSGLDFNVDCQNCGTKGSIAISGKISYKLLDGVQSLEITATPSNIEFDLGLAFGISGNLTDDWSKSFNILNTGLPGFSIPEILEVGPIFSIDAGFDLKAVQGSASISSGITAKIPNSATATLDIVGTDDSSFSGWEPTISTLPIEVSAEVDGSLELFTSVGLDIGVTAFGAGFGAGFTLKIPDVTLNVGAEFDNLGACEGHNETFGVKFSGGVGADLSMNAYAESKDVKTQKWEKDLLNKPDIYAFPSQCLPFGAAPSSPISVSSTSVATTTAPSSTSSSAAKSSSASGAPTSYGSKNATATASSYNGRLRRHVLY
ncbi:Uu.00g145150.m01.CDS01 [Anthostomella pinea]|uniref:Uu.00g145150.m01.CDS01 n=1 Tax=Anthostomella pinea TaxID=933095 RepID=A0AAI8VRN0_9PEZI|nr:Uu.00g145150.m01.CDS01 [Anthostomella pinea]